MKVLSLACLVVVASAADAQVAAPPASPPAQTAQPSTASPAAGQATDSRVVVTGRKLVPVPNVGEGAAYHSVDDLRATSSEARRDGAEASVDARRCQTGEFPAYATARAPTMEVVLREENAAAVSLANLSEKAAKATEAAITARADAADGLVDMKAVETAELARQDAVAKLDKAQEKFTLAVNQTADLQDIIRNGRQEEISWGELAYRESKRRKLTAADIRAEFDGLKLQGIRSEEFRDPKKGLFLRVTGSIQNSRTSNAFVPAIYIAPLDERGYLLSSAKVDAGRGSRIKAGQSAPFIHDMKPIPDGAKGVVVYFASKATPPPRLPTYMFCGEGGLGTGRKTEEELDEANK